MSEVKINLQDMATFGVAGNFTGHLEQAGEAVDFLNVKTKEAKAPKAIFPTYIPGATKENVVPEFLGTFPFDESKIIFPANEEKLQIEPECAVVFNAEWQDGKVTELKPVCFGASNDCSIRKEGAKKISQKKNWGPSSKGFSSQLIPVDSFSEKGIMNGYRIASFLVREKDVFAYGEDSAIRDYSYIWGTLVEWMKEKFNGQADEGPAENIGSYLEAADFPKQVMVSIGATRYTEYGETHFLQTQDRSVVVLYPESDYSKEQIVKMVADGSIHSAKNVSVLDQTVVQ